MNAMLIIKTANGYVATPCQPPALDACAVADMSVAVSLESRSYMDRGKCLIDILSDYFEPPIPATKSDEASA